MHKAIDRRMGEVLGPSQLAAILGQLRKEHVELRLHMERIEWAADQVERMADAAAAVKEIQGIKELLRHFMESLEQHAAWEEESLIPVIEEYFRRSYSNRIDDSIWTMEKDHEMGCMYLRLFLQKETELDAQPDADKVAEAVRCLLQGCILLREHLRIEEQIVFPLIEEVLAMDLHRG
ncbi:hemerythrin domain-containing protein [Paenibacillus oenotherae]|nr:hemerythrin domain-containing protein [Paenibacillus oenotherae]